MTSLDRLSYIHLLYQNFMLSELSKGVQGILYPVLTVVINYILLLSSRYPLRV